MKRGEVWTAAGGAAYAGKPRPMVIVQSDHFDDTQSVTVCGFTTTLLEAELVRVRVAPAAQNSLLQPCMMVDKISSVPRPQLGRPIGRLSAEDITRLDRALFVFLGLAG